MPAEVSMNPKTRPLTMKVWVEAESVVFSKVAEEWGGFSNMSNAYLLEVEGVELRSSEALYQALKFPHLPAVQREIVREKSPMSAKMKAKKHVRSIRSDWEDRKVDVMWWCLRVKLALHLQSFGRLLRTSGERPIVEASHKDRFWGTVEVEPGVRAGVNELGVLLMHIRAEFLARGDAVMRVVGAPGFPDAVLLGKPIHEVKGREPRRVGR